jgi:predicted small secreted protein
MRIAILGATALLLAGCNTVEGFGRDLGATGDALAGAARDTRDGKPSKTQCRTEAGRPSNIPVCQKNARR